MSYRYRSVEDYERAAEHPAKLLWMVFGIGLASIMVVGSCGYVMGWFAETAQVVQEEFGPREALRKYEWFKDAAAALDKKRADLTIYEARFQSLENAYKGQPRSAWARDDREQWSIWQSEAAGVKASYNTLAADYNAQMAKFNWAFAEAGRLPRGAAEPLPREFKPYMEESR